jgi:hypothetical protein
MTLTNSTDSITGITKKVSLLDKALNGKTTALGVLSILAVIGLQSMGVLSRGGGASAKDDMEVVLSPMIARMYERTEQFQKTQLEIITNQKSIMEILQKENDLLQNRSIYFERISNIQSAMLDEIKEMRRNRP